MTFQALAMELKHPLLIIARRAELADAEALEDIQFTAEQTLRLLDSCILHAQTEYGQTALNMEPATLGSVLYEAQISLRQHAQKRNVSLVIDDKTHEPVMIHKPALTAILSVFGNTLMSLHRTNKHQEIIMRGFKIRGGRMAVGLFSDVNLSATDIKKGLELQGRAHMPLSSAGNASHISMLIADGLCKAVGGSMRVKKMGGLTGLVTEIPSSEQLALI